MPKLIETSARLQFFMEALTRQVSLWNLHTVAWFRYT